MRVNQYAKNYNKPIEDREKNLFECMDLLDSQSLEVFGQIASLDRLSLYKLEDLFSLLNNLIELYNDTFEAYSHLEKVESTSGHFSRARFLLKIAASIGLTVWSFKYNPYLATALFAVLSSHSVEYYSNETGAIIDRLFKFNDEQMSKIEFTLENCNHMLNGKNDRSYQINDLPLVFQANYYIKHYIQDDISYEEISALPEPIINLMITILSKDFGDKGDLLSLLESAKKKHNDNLELIKSFN